MCSVMIILEGILDKYFENEHGILYHGDCLEIMPELNVGADMILTDPPYGTTACKWDTVIPFKPMWECVWGNIKKNGAVVLTASQPFTSNLIMSQIKKFKYCWVWNKVKPSNFINAKYCPMKITEDIVVFSYGTHNYYPIMEEKTGNTEYHEVFYSKNRKTNDVNNVFNIGFDVKYSEDYNFKLKYPTNLITESIRSTWSKTKKKLHPTQKPVSLFEYLIKTYTNEGETVLDFCAGSGTTAIACMNTNRKFVLIEKEEKYCEVIAKRIEEYKEAA